MMTILNHICDHHIVMERTPDPFLAGIKREESGMEAKRLMRDDARKAFVGAGLTYKDLSRENLRVLREFINGEMLLSGCLQGTFRCRQRPFFHSGPRFFAGIKCRAFYFDGREAVSFNPDGFIGFAGWADDKNVQPILRGFSRWVDALTKKEGAA